MARRGESLREHILWAAKDAFLEMGFERTSMDVVAARAETSKRTLYAHFESKENLFLAVIELSRTLFLKRMGNVEDYTDDPTEALTLFCGRYLEAMLYEAFVRMCRIGMAEAARFPQGAARLFDVVFTEVRSRLGAYLGAAFGLDPTERDVAAGRLVGEVLYPRWPRALFGVDPMLSRHDGEGVSHGFDLAPVRRAVEDLVASQKRPLGRAAVHDAGA